jgi:t-SNARE complex subunit (syntaxin)
MDINERVEKLEQHVSEIDARIDEVEKKTEGFFSKLFKRIDNLDGKLTKMTKWIYRLLAIIIVLLIVIAINSPQTATQILSSAGTVIKAI